MSNLSCPSNNENFKEAIRMGIACENSESYIHIHYSDKVHQQLHLKKNGPNRLKIDTSYVENDKITKYQTDVRYKIN